MSTHEHLAVPLKLRLKASLIGGVIGALNPMIFSFKQFALAPQTASKTYLVTAGGFISLWLIIPCLVATYLAYPLLYRMIITSLESKQKARPFVWGLKFGFFATALAVVFVSIELAVVGLIGGLAADGLIPALMMAFAGILYIGFIALFYTPMILISGYLYALGNLHVIKKYYHPNAKENP